MSPGAFVAKFSTRHPWVVTAVMVQLAVILAVLALLPTFWPERFATLNGVKVDTDPENMLPKDQPVRVFHDRMKEEMSLYDMVVVGVVNDTHPEGVFNPASLQRVYELTEFAKQLRWPDPENPDRTEGVIRIDIIAPSTVDSIEQGDGPGTINFRWLMRSPPETREEALAVRRRAERIPFLDGTLLSEDGRALAIYLPLSSKDLSSRVYDELQEKIATFEGNDEFHITGLPVAEDVFGVQMFKQMAISAPLAMVVIFLLMLLFFRRLSLILSPMIVAVVCVVATMSLLVISGKTVHIMSSMIPIFIMPIAVLDAVHILSEFFDRYQDSRDREKTIVRVMETLFLPMLYTSLTTAVGFGSLALVSIPPVQVFGVFVAFGVLMAWLWTITFIPAFIMFIPARWLENFGIRAGAETADESGALSRLLRQTGRLTYRHAGTVLVGVVIVSVVAVYGITLIRINDNPIKWFERGHPIRVADRTLNDHFGGTYMAYLTLGAEQEAQTPAAYVEALGERLRDYAAQQDVPHLPEAVKSFLQEAQQTGNVAESQEAVLDRLEEYADKKLFSVPDDHYRAWDGIMSFVSSERTRDQTFKQPQILRYIGRLQQHLRQTEIVGKSNSLTDIVKTVRRELVSGKPEDFKVPDSPSGVAQTLLQYQNSHRPQDLWHLVTPDYRTSVIWLQLTSGDNRDMEHVVRAVDEFMAQNPAPLGVDLKHRWFGLTYINVIWQDKMVAGMLRAFLGSFLIVFLMMTLLYRSALWGLLSMVPLTVTIAVIYGVIGLIGKDYDMPVAVLSSLSLGLAIDYAIHFLSRSRFLYAEHGSWQKTAGPVFDEPARAISRNAIVIGVGFLPLLAAPLVPYKTVGVFIAAILLTAGLASLLILPALITVLEPLLFPRTRKCCLICNCASCTAAAFAIVGIVAANVYSYLQVGWTDLTWLSFLAVVVLAQVCYFIGKSKRCRADIPANEMKGEGDQ